MLLLGLCQPAGADAQLLPACWLCCIRLQNTILVSRKQQNLGCTWSTIAQASAAVKARSGCTPARHKQEYKTRCGMRKSLNIS